MKMSSLCLLLAISLTTSAQFAPIPMGGTMLPSGQMAFSKAHVVSGDPAALEGKRIQVFIIYDSMAVVDYGGEKEFINAMTEHFEAKKPGRGAAWAEDWQVCKNTKFKQLFIDKFNDMGKQTMNSAQTDTTSASYQLVITIKSLDPGYEAWITHEPALIDATCDFRDKAGQTVLSVTMDQVPGQVFGKGNFDLNLRVGQCYAKLAKDLYKFISKKYKIISPSYDE